MGMEHTERENAFAFWLSSHRLVFALTYFLLLAGQFGPCQQRGNQPCAAGTWDPAFRHTVFPSSVSILWELSMELPVL